MAQWHEPYLKTWLAWPQFDPQDHEQCDIIDQNNQSTPKGIAKTWLPYHETAVVRNSDQAWVQPWAYQKHPPSDALSFNIRVWQRD
jgi:hypothetical protein